MATTKVRTYNYLISCGHLCSDINQGALAAVLPFLIAAYHYDYATAATLVLFSNLVGSVVQPIFGQLADRHNRPWLIPLGLLLAGGGMALTGVPQRRASARRISASFLSAAISVLPSVLWS